MSVTVFFILLSLSGFSQKIDSLTFTSSDSSDRQVVKWEQEMSITACYSDINDIHHRDYIQGRFMHATADSVYLDIDLHRQNQFDMLDSTEHQFYKSFEIRYHQTGDVSRIMKGFLKENICSVSIDKYPISRTLLNSISGLGLLNALVVAPLVSINYKTGEFNSNRYYTYSGISLASTIITFTFSRTLIPKKYKFGKSQRRRYVFN